LKSVGFVGVGVMGAGMVKNLLQAGFHVSVYNRTREKAEGVLALGARWCESPGDCAEGKDAVVTIVGYPADVEGIYFGPGGILDRAKKGAALIDMTTTSPAQAQRIHRAAAERGMDFLDAPVSGGQGGAAAGTLAIMVGGDKAAFDRCMPIFSAMGKNIVYEGPPGAGQHTKAANQIALSGALCGAAEAISYAIRAGLDPERMLATIMTGAAGSWQLSNQGPRMISGDDSPVFYTKHFIKDLKIAMDEGTALGADLSMTSMVLGRMERLAQEGKGDLGTQAIIHTYL